MTGFVIDVGAHSDQAVLSALAEKSDRLANSVIGTKRNTLFGNRSFDRQADSRYALEAPELRAELARLTANAIEDARHHVVGHQRRESGPMTNYFGKNIAIAKDGGIAQAGDGAKQAVQSAPSKRWSVASALAKLRKLLGLPTTAA